MGRTRPQRRPHTCTYKHTESQHSCSAGRCVAIQAEHLQDLSRTTTRTSGVSLVTEPPAACQPFQIWSAGLRAFRRTCSSRKAQQVSGYSSWISHCWLGLSSFSGITTTCSLSYVLPPAEREQTAELKTRRDKRSEVETWRQTSWRFNAWQRENISSHQMNNVWSLPARPAAPFQAAVQVSSFH